MMWLYTALLGVLQGITEFLPISSSGHLVLAQYFLPGFSEVDANDHGKEQFFDGMLHLGTLLAVLVYFAREVRQHMRLVMQGEAKPLLAEWPSTWRHLIHLGLLVALATVPAAAVTLWKNEEIKQTFKQPDFVAGNFLILGAVLLLTDWLGRRHAGTTVGPQTSWWQALLIGGAQACSAVFRGLSRSGMTIASALLVGLERSWAVRFSFLMSVVASFGLGAKGIRDALKDTDRHVWLTSEFLAMTLVATLISAVVGYLTITPLIRLVQKCQLWWFAIYVWVVGLAVLFFKEPIRAALQTALGS
jgi:undecaprenyl-diphosphatase